MLGEGVASIVIRILCKLSFSNDAYNFEFPARTVSKKQVEVLDLQQCTEQMKYPDSRSRECVGYGISGAAGGWLFSEAGRGEICEYRHAVVLLLALCCNTLLHLILFSCGKKIQF